MEGLEAHGVSWEPPANVACGGDVEEGAQPAGDAHATKLPQLLGPLEIVRVEFHF